MFGEELKLREVANETVDKPYPGISRAELVWFKEIERSNQYHKEERERATIWNAEQRATAVLERAAREQRFPKTVFPIV
jgi:hypothetical protein